MVMAAACHQGRAHDADPGWASGAGVFNAKPNYLSEGGGDNDVRYFFINNP